MNTFLKLIIIRHGFIDRILIYVYIIYVGIYYYILSII